MRNLLVFLGLVMVGVVLAGCPDEKKDANAPSATGTGAAASASASATPKAAGSGGAPAGGW